jgi:hypothetical protein
LFLLAPPEARPAAGLVRISQKAASPKGVGRALGRRFPVFFGTVATGFVPKRKEQPWLARHRDPVGEGRVRSPVMDNFVHNRLER